MRGKDVDRSRNVAPEVAKVRVDTRARNEESTVIAFLREDARGSDPLALSAERFQSGPCSLN